PSHGVDLVVFDLGEDDLFLHADVVVPATVERAARHAAEVAHPGEGDRHQAIEELVHPPAAQGDHAPDGIALADLEARDRLAGAGHDRLLACDPRATADGVLEHLLVGHGLTHAHVQRDLLDPGDLHDRLVPELLHRCGDDLFAITLLEPSHHFLSNPRWRHAPRRGIGVVDQALTCSPFDLKYRTLVPSWRKRKPTRSPFPVAGL